MSDAETPESTGTTSVVNVDDRSPTLTHARRVRPLDPGRLSVYAVLGGASGIVPLPWLPDAIARRIRGALVQDIARRHGMGLPREAREVLAEPSGTEGPRGILGQIGTFVGKRLLARIGPLGVFAPVKVGLDTFVLGHLFHRYLETERSGRGRRIDVVEARRVRQAIDQALTAALTVDVNAPGGSSDPLPGDDRDAMTAVIDGLLDKTAGVPSFLVARIEAAFDERLPHADG